MSLLADLLARIKQPDSKREVSPNLRNIVEAASRRSGIRRKILLLTCLFAAAVVTGIALTYVGRSLLETESAITMPEGTVAANTDIRTEQRDDISGTKNMQQIADATEKVPIKPANAMPDAEKKTAPEPVASGSARAPSQEKAGHKAPDVTGGGSSLKAGLKTVPDKETDRKSAAFLYAARKYERDNDYLHALSNYRKALELDADNFRVMNNIAFIYLKLDLPDEAMAYARKALERNGDYVPALMNMAIAYARSGKYDDAERSFNDAADLDPDNQTLLLNRALLHERQENFSKAFDLYSRLGRLGDGDGLLGQARIYEKQGQTQKAIMRYRDISMSETVDDAFRIRAQERLIVLLKKN